ncbi:unnamed protein product [Discula destructiva]
MDAENSPPASRESLLVDFEGTSDVLQPRNWPFGKKIFTSLLYIMTSLGSVWASTADAPATAKIAAEMNVSDEVIILGTSLLLFGWGFGPLLWAPLSEVYGRKWPVLAPFAVAVAMSLGTAASKDIQTYLITRFFTGLFSSSSITSTGGVFVDLWDASQRGNAVVAYTFVVSGAPSLAPVVSGAVVHYGLGWRWTEWITSIIMAVVLGLAVLFVDESYPPVLLSRKAARLRRSTGNWALHSASEEGEVRLQDLAVKYGLRPLQMLATPICFAVTLYTAFIYAIFYASVASFPIIFQQTRGWDDLIGSLPYLAVLLGMVLGAVLNWLNQRHYNSVTQARGQAVPEARLPPMMIGSVVLAAGLFLIGWTSYRSVPWPATMIGAVMMGFGRYAVFTSALNYLIDAFERWGASALAANTFMRSLLAAVLPLVVKPMFAALGNGWAYSVLGIFAALNIPMPFVFYFYGTGIRKRGKYSGNLV